MQGTKFSKEKMTTSPNKTRGFFRNPESLQKLNSPKREKYFFDHSTEMFCFFFLGFLFNKHLLKFLLSFYYSTPCKKIKENQRKAQTAMFFCFFFVIIL